MSDDYLWDGTGEPDAEVRALEERLRVLRRVPPPPTFTGVEPALGLWRFAALAAAALLALSLAASTVHRNAVQGWDLAWLDGASWPASRVVRRERLAAGGWIETHGSRARLSVGRIGDVRLEPRTRVGLVDAGERSHHLSLARGVMHASIWAPPGAFVVDTPSAVAVDMGCRYTLEVDENGAGLLRVESGWVGFEHAGRLSRVPAGAVCRTRSGSGPGTPRFLTAAPGFAVALETIDFGSSHERRPALDRVLAEARPRDALSLWHLLARLDGEERRRVHDRLHAFVPAPPGVTREDVLRGDQTAWDAWWNELDLGSSEFWRLWASDSAPLAGQR